MLQHSFEQITRHVHWLSPNSETDRPTLGVVAGTRGTLIVEAGNSPAHARHLLDEMAHRGMAAPTFVALTHWHWDHVLGASEFRALLIASVATKRIVDDMAQWEWSDEALTERVAKGIEIEFCRENIVKELPDRSGLVVRAPEIGFENRLVLDLGDVMCEMIHVGGDHAADSSIVYVPQDKVVFLGDCLYLDIYHTPNRYTKGKLYPLIDTLLGLDAEIYFEGHNPKPTTRAELAEFTTLLRTIGDTVMDAGQDRGEIFEQVNRKAGVKVLEEDVEYVDAFLEGLRGEGDM